MAWKRWENAWELNDSSSSGGGGSLEPQLSMITCQQTILRDVTHLSAIFIFGRPGFNKLALYMPDNFQAKCPLERYPANVTNAAVNRQ